MSVAAPIAHEETIDGTGHAHPSDRNYVNIALFLGVVTALEVAASYIDMAQGIFIPLVLVMMVVKFFVVAAWFMHLRFDSRLFRRLFIAGLVLAVAVYMGVMTSMQFFGDDTTSERPVPTREPVAEAPAVDTAG